MPHERRSGPEQLALGLACFGAGLGLMELLAPSAVARLVGLPEETEANKTIRAMGVRELASTAAILSKPGSAGPVWSRVAGDAVDLALVLRAMSEPGARRGRSVAALAAIAGAAALDGYVAARLQRRAEAAADRPISSAEAITIGKPVDEVYEFWKDLENFPSFLRNLDKVEDLGDGRSRWQVTGPAGVPVTWEAQIITDQDNHMISWRSVPGSLIRNRGAVRFEVAPGRRGTEVHAEISYWPPAGDLGHLTAWAFGRSPRQQLREGLRRIKQILELGEIPLSEAPGLSRPAQPASAGLLNELAGVRS